MNAVRLINEGEWGKLVALRGTEIITTTFEAALGQLKTVPDERWEEASLLFG
jgi:6-phosphofructokinase 1